MKVSCILTSFNRPTWIKHSLQSIENQTHTDVQLIVIDESDAFDIHETLKQFRFKELIVRHFDSSAEARRLENKLSANCNLGLSLATGDLVCFLADDDYYYPTWFAAAAAYFSAHSKVYAAFGKLVYSSNPAMVLPDMSDPSQVRFPKDIVTKPFGLLDHNQIMHRRFDPPFSWPLAPSTVGGPDAFYFRDIAQKHPFHPIATPAAVKRIHDKGLMVNQAAYIHGFMDGVRE